MTKRNSVPDFDLMVQRISALESQVSVIQDSLAPLTSGDSELSVSNVEQSQEDVPPVQMESRSPLVIQNFNFGKGAIRAGKGGGGGKPGGGAGGGGKPGGGGGGGGGGGAARDPDLYHLEVCKVHRIWGNPGPGNEKRTVSVSGAHGNIPDRAVINVFVAPEGYEPAPNQNPPPPTPPGASAPWTVNPAQQKTKNGNTVPAGHAIYVHELSAGLGPGAPAAPGFIDVKIVDTP